MPNYSFDSTKLKIPSMWLQVIQDVQKELGPECLIHGGSLRDLALGKSPEDIDIAIPFNPDKDGELRFFMPSYWCPISKVKKYRKTQYADGVPQISGDIHNFTVSGLAEPVQIIPYRFSREWFGRHVINGNDFGMNQIGFDGKRILFNTRFETDVNTKTFTFHKLGTAYMAQNAINRAKGWKYGGKYDGFRFDCSKAEEFLKHVRASSLLHAD